jgi:hypothetical protein
LDEIFRLLARSAHASRCAVQAVDVLAKRLGIELMLSGGSELVREHRPPQAASDLE